MAWTAPTVAEKLSPYRRGLGRLAVALALAALAALTAGCDGGDDGASGAQTGDAVTDSVAATDVVSDAVSDAVADGLVLDSQGPDGASDGQGRGPGDGVSGPDVAASDGTGADSLGPDGGAPCGTTADCPVPTSKCVQALCHPTAGCVEVAMPDDALCNDDDACTLSSLCDKGACVAGPLKTCDDGASCTTDTCDAKTGACQHTPTAGAACDDGSACTDGDTCDEGGKCAPGKLVCACQESADCAKFENGDACDGTLFCDPETSKCQVNPASLVLCPSAKDTQCAKNLCDPASGKCAMTPAKAGTSCDDGVLCTANDACADGSCKGGQSVCCQSDKDCAGFEDGDACNGTLYCQVSTGKCVLNPATIVVCPSAADTGCTKNLCDAKTGTCAPQSVNEGKTCDDGNACTPNDTCVKGTCTATANSCTCQSDLDCGKYEDGDLCNGTLYCDIAAKDPTCKVNPVTVVFCPTVDDTGCLKNTCNPKTAKCSLVPLADKKPCDADGNNCTVHDTCLNGACKPDVNTCPCQKDAECKAKEDGNLCNGTLYCNKASNKCEVNPATLVSCASANDTQCTKNRCNPVSGQCGPVKLHDYAKCEFDGTQCTLNDACVNGVCTQGKNLCQCKLDGHCDRFEDSDQCNGTLYCNKKNQPYVCTPNPASAVLCEKGKDGPCLKNLCQPGSGDCKLTAIDEGVACSDGDQCKTKPTCKAGSCSGGKLQCDDSNPCTVDTCAADKGCVFLPQSATVCDDGNSCTTDTCDKAQKGDGCVHVLLKTGASCEDGDKCSTGDSCQGGVCAGGKVADCDDDNDCSVDSCDKGTGCAHKAGQDGKVCDDGDACTVATACKTGKCVGQAAGCDDGEACTTDACNPKAVGKDPCLHVPKATGQACDDGDPCTWADGCDAKGTCVGKAKDCDDGNACTDDTCAKGKGCVATANQATCDDGDVCTKGDVCAGGVCLPGEATLCDDNNPCTQDACEKAGNKGCTHTATNAQCSDGSVCTTDDACDSKGACTGKAKDCSDGQVCTDDSCDKALGCQNVPNTAKCVDGDSCTTNDHCAGGKCGGDPVDCGDGNPCTDDACDGKAGCTHTANTASCNDGNPCTTGEACSAKQCQGGKATDCDDKDDCTKDSCGAKTGCAHAALSAGSCDDGDPCTSGTACSSGQCVGGSKTDCDDKNACTADTCDATGKGCVHTAQLGVCDDGNACTSGDLCADGVCLPGEATSCNDGNPCTKDSCDATGKVTGKAGCVHAAAAGVCDDGDLCTDKDACNEGKCVGSKKSCDDSEPCTVDSCDAKLGCQHKTSTAPCIDGDSCTTQDKCVNGKCVGQKVDCSDGNPCTDDSCDGKKGCVHAANTAECTDGNACTSGDTCANGSCKSGSVLSCDDGNPCTAGSCDPVTGCKQTAKSGSCDDGDPCTSSDACASGACLGKGKSCDDSDACTDDACDAKTGQCVHANNAAACSDGDACTTGETCQSGACTGGSSISCDDGNPCTDDACSKALGCVAVANTAPCDDGDACTTSDTCGKGSCAGTTVSCDDGDPCTADACDPLTGSCAAKPGNEGAVCGGGGRWCHAGVCKWAKSVVQGKWHTCALHPNGTLSCWGGNDYGALGRGSSQPSSAPLPAPVPGLKDVVEVTAGEFWTCARTSTDKLFCWGINQQSNLSVGESSSSIVSAKQVLKFDGTPLSLSGGRSHRCALRDDGRVRCWGSNSGGQLGQGTSNGGYTSVMSTVLNMVNAKKVLCSRAQCLAEDKDGKVWGWGYNFYGMMGLGGADSQYVTKARAVPLRTGPVDYAVSNVAGCHLDGEGDVYCAGKAEAGQLGLGYSSTGKLTVPARLRTLPKVVDVGAGDYHFCAATVAGDVYCWGNNDYGELGTSGDKFWPHKVAMPATTGRVVQVAGGQKSQCVLTELGEVWCWGHNTKGQLGRGTLDNGSATPTLVAASKAVPAAVCKSAGYCDDQDPCTVDTCDAKTGKCAHAAGNDGGACGQGLVCSAGACKAPYATALQVGDDHGCALQTDGRVSCWGDDAAGQLGDGTAGTGAALATKTVVGGVAHAAQVFVGGRTSCARDIAGAVRCWGANDANQAGRGSGSAAVLPKAGAVTVATGLTALALGGAHACGLHVSGRVACWGGGSAGQLGDGKGADSAAAVWVSTLERIVQVSSGPAHSCALQAGGQVWCWGQGALGQLGHGKTGVLAKAPVAVSGVSDALAVAVGGSHSCAIRAAGQVVCWGGNADSQLGRVSAATGSAGLVAGVSGATRLALGDRHSCALTKSGDVYCWGRNASGQAGTTGAVVKMAKKVAGLPKVAAVGAGKQHTCALSRDGGVYCWGAGGKGQLGGASAQSASPVVVKGTAAATNGCASKTCDDGLTCTADTCDPFSGGCRHTPRADGSACNVGSVCAAGACKPAFAKTLATGRYHACVIGHDSVTRCWGANDADEVSAGASAAVQPKPVAAHGVGEASALGLGFKYSCAANSDGSGTCWGRAESYETGRGANHSGGVPAAVSGLKGATAVAAGRATACAVTAAGGLWCWGANGSGQVGDGSTAARKTPVQILGLQAVTAAASGVSHTCAVHSGGKVACWGANTHGQLGDGTTTARTQPTAVQGIDDAVAVTAGDSFTCAVRSGGWLSCWGRGSGGRLGHGSEQSSAAPVDVPGIGGVVAVDAGLTHTCAVDSAGRVLCWGTETHGALGGGASKTTQLTPAAVSGVGPAASVSLGDNLSCARLRTGEVRCWGWQAQGMVGNGATSGDATTPAQVSGSAPGVDLCVVNKVDCDDSNPCTVDTCVPKTGKCSYTKAEDGLSCGDLRQCHAGACAFAVGVAAGTNTTCALRPGGGVACWGQKTYALGPNGQDLNKDVPVTVPVEKSVQLVGGRGHYCVLTAVGEVQCWGNGSQGQLGRGGATSSPSPVWVIGLNDVSWLAGSGRTTCAKRAAGGVMCWGENKTDRELQGTAWNYLTPVSISVPSDLTGLAHGWGNHHAALTQSGKLYVWGDNTEAQIGTGKPSSSGVPTPFHVSALTGVTAASHGWNTVCAVHSGGKVSCWGYDVYGATGTGSSSTSAPDVLQPTELKGVSGVAEIALGKLTGYARLTSGAVKAWGANGKGQCGNGSQKYTGEGTPVDVKNLADAVQLAPGEEHVCALRKNGSVVCWGINSYGQLGIGAYSYTDYRSTPHTVYKSAP